MKLKDLIDEIKVSLLANKTRTFLTVLGIVIGIASVIVMLAVGAGAQQQITSSINSLGTNILTVRSGGGGRPGEANTGTEKPFTFLDAEAIEDKVPNIKAVAPLVQTRAQAQVGNKNMNATILGVTDTYQEVGNVKVAYGNFITESQSRSFSKVAVLGSIAATNLFGEDDPIGEQVKIKTNNYTVVGVAESKGGSGFQNPDEYIYLPINTAMQYISGNNNLGSIAVTTEKSDQLTQVQEDLTNFLLKRRNIENKDLADFRILNQQELLATVSSITGIFTMLLGSVAGISLLVGGIGIMNMMLTTVRERTKEIGLRKALGAKEKDLRKQFLFEAVVVTLSGGILGTLLGYLISWVINLSGLISTSVSFSSVMLAFSVSVFIGVVFGYYPAKKAGKLNPIDALRYE
jgi:putative ABC transport system permease protein